MKQDLIVESLSKRFGSKRGLNNISFRVPPGKIYVILGESGSGKTTLLRIIAGLEKADFGDVHHSGKNIMLEPPEKRQIGLVFQDYALFPHLTVVQNIGYGANKNKSERVMQLLEDVHLVGLGNRYPHQLSGGQQQRVALARAIAMQPKILLMDEPFSNLDPIRKSELHAHIKHLVTSVNVPTIVITHDSHDAVKLADEIIILKEGNIIQSGPPEQIKSDPSSEYVRALIC